MFPDRCVGNVAVNVIGCGATGHSQLGCPHQGQRLNHWQAATQVDAATEKNSKPVLQLAENKHW